jgi:hypothetical protein
MMASLVTGHWHYKINNFAAFKKGMGANHRGQIAPNQEVPYSHCRWYVKGNGARAGASNDRKPTNDGAVGYGSNNLPNLSAICVLKTHRNWYKSLHWTQ